MILFKKIDDLQQYLATQCAAGRQIGFVPTMGALHKGHISLIGEALKNNNLVVCSIFVNPTQFNDNSDFEQYPVTISEDMILLADAGCDVLFLPEVNEIYPNGAAGAASFDFGYLDTILEGAQRPGHFKGVGQVVSILLDAVKPQYLYMGQKDYQQCMVVKKLLQITGKADKTEMIMGSTVREDDGLAMSSRNRRLTEPQRLVASTIYQCLVSIEGKKNIAKFEIVKKECWNLLVDKGFVPEYVAIASASDLTLLNDYVTDAPMVALIAAKIGGVRLIDNLLLSFDK